MAMRINTFEPIVPNCGLGGLRLRTHVSEIDDVIRDLATRYEMVSPFEARYSFGDGSVQAAVDVRNGRIFKLIASKSYAGSFGAIHLDMLVGDAILADPRLYYCESEEYIVCRGVDGITLSVPVMDPDPSDVPALRISAISVYALEIDTAEGQIGRW
jgi:hypothetical protein